MSKMSRILTFLGAVGVLAAALVPGGVLATSPAEATGTSSINLWRPGDSGQPLRISGWVRSTSGKPISGATIWIRGADGDGVYTHHQGQLKTAEDGSYRFSTVLPGQYYGIKHIHIGAAHDGYEYLETRILFKGDPNLDPESTEKLAIHLEEATVNDATVLFGRFDMILKPLGGD